jgi:ubiquitin C-terminal hydrolase
MSESQTRSVLDGFATLDSHWKNRSEESAQLLSLLVDYLGIACDSSSRTTRGRIDRYSKDQEAQNKQGNLLFDVQADADAYWTAFCGEGHQSDVTDKFLSQIVKEIPCAQDHCAVVSRGFEHTFVEYLDFPQGSTAVDEFNLEVLLDMWAHETLSEGAGHKCEHVPEHPESLKIVRRFTEPAQNICLAFRRGMLGKGAVEYFNHVNLPETLDIAPYTDLVGLPSRRHRPTEAEAEYPALNYDLVSVNNWKSGHYIGYALVTLDGEKQWVMFNDLQTAPVKKTPFQGHAEVSRHSSIWGDID